MVGVFSKMRVMDRKKQAEFTLRFSTVSSFLCYEVDMSVAGINFVILLYFYGGFKKKTEVVYFLVPK